MTNFRDILCVVDIADECTAALDRAVTLAENNQANLTVVDVVDRVTAGIGMPEGGPISANLQSTMETRHAEALETLIGPFRQHTPITTKILSGTRFLEIIREVLSGGHDLVIKTPEKLAWLDRLFGSDDMNLMRECPCPVWLMKPQAEKTYKRILAAVDVDDRYPPSELKSRHALNQTIFTKACSLALSDFAELHVVHVWQAIGESVMRGAFMRTPEAEITTYVAQERNRHETNLNGFIREITGTLGKEAAEYIQPRAHLLKGSARQQIPSLAQQLEADVIVMGTVARTGIPGFIMGNTAETILNQIDCSVLAIKPPGFETPVTTTD
jgi:nucleotide-binding universal stress UspA family protein